MKRKQVMLALTAAAGLSLTALYSAPAAKAAPLHDISVSMPSSDSYIIKAGKLNVRTEPNHKGKILGTISSEKRSQSMVSQMPIGLKFNTKEKKHIFQHTS